MNILRLMTAIAFALLACCTFALPSRAVTTGPIDVQKCDPEPGGTVLNPGFIAGFYPITPYYFWDVFGYRYLEPALSAPNPTLSIDFLNRGPLPATMIEFGLVARGHMIAEVRDEGVFSPSVEIKHSYGLNPNVFPLGSALPLCVLLRVRFANDTLWINPKLPSVARSIYAP